MKQQWQSLSPRAQLATAVIAGTSLVALAVLGVLNPLDSWRRDLAEQQEVLGRELQTVQALASDLQQLRARPVQEAATGSSRPSLSALVDESLQGRPFQPSRMQLSESGQMQLRLDAVVFDEALAWLHELETYPGVLATAVSVNEEDGGRVSVGLTLQQL